MELKPGYKQTEAGIIPGNWGSKPLGDICIKIQDGTHFSPAPGGNDYLYVTSKNIRPGVLDVSNAERIDAMQHRAIYARCDVRKGDLLLTKDGANTGNAALNHLDEEFSLLSSVALLRFDPRYHVAGYYVQQILSADGQKLIKELMVGNAITRITLEKIRKISFPIPSLPEQRAIAAALSDTDALLSSLDRLLAKKRDIKQAVMQQLLTGKQRLPGFSGEWEVKRLGNVGSFSKGRGLAKENINLTGRVPAVPYTAIYTDFSEVVRHSEIKQYTDPSVDHSLVKGPILLIASSSNMLENIGKATAYVDNLDVAVGGDIIIYKTVMDVRFLAYLLSTRPHRLKIRFLSQGSTIRHVYSSTFSSYELALPSLDEQIAIVAVLSDMDAEIDALTQRRDKTRALKQGMMQELLTGRTRLV